MSTASVHRVVRLTARTSALLFAAAQVTSAARPTRRASRRLYAAFLLAHTAHFAAVTRYAIITGGRHLFPGGRNLADVGGWPTMAGIFGVFYGLAATGWPAPPRALLAHWVRRPVVRGVSTGVIAAMFASVYLQRLRALGSDVTGRAG
jgi:hypothetical protein